MAELVGADEFRHFAANLKVAEKSLRLQVNRAIREVAKPIAVEVVQRGSEVMPRRGGLRDLLMQAKPTVSIGARAVTLNLRDAGGHNLSLLNKGDLRHPVFVHGKVTGARESWTWVSEPVPSGSYTAAFEAIAPERAEPEVVKAINEVLDAATEGLH